MSLSSSQALILIIIISLATIITRGLPFILFPRQENTPSYIIYLGEVLPFASIGLLIIYCLRNVSLLSAPYGLPEGIAVLFVIGLHLWKNNSLLSIGGGTVFYMLLVQTIFG